MFNTKSIVARFPRLTEREASIVAQLAHFGGSNADIAAELGITERTVKNVLTVVPLKMGIPGGGSSRVRIVLAAHAVGAWAS